VVDHPADRGAGESAGILGVGLLRRRSQQAHQRRYGHAGTVTCGLLSAFEALAPWPADRGLDAGDWSRYFAAARAVQDSNPGEVDRALAELLDRGDPDDETRLFLLSRVVFELPERAPAAERRSRKGWTNRPEPEADGTVDLSWPVRWEGRRPRLEAPLAGAEGPRYAAVEEFRDLRARYPFRSLPAA
jgi:hypothetical protein